MQNPILIIFIFIVMLTDGFSKDNIEIPIQYMPQHLDPSLVNDTNGQFILNNLADGLLGWSFENGISPEISSSWKEVKKGTLIFTLRSNLKDFNGEEFSCKQIAEILKSHKKVNGPFISFYKKLKNIKCINPTLLLIESSFSTKELLAFLSGPAGKIIKINNYHIEKGIASFNIKLINNSLRLTKNKNYYNSEKIYFNNVSLVVLEDKVAVDKFINKGIDLILLSNLGIEEKSRLSKESLVSRNLWSTWGLAFNKKIKPFDSDELRACLIDSIDSRDWVSSFYQDNIPAYGPIPPGIIGHSKKAWKSGKKYSLFKNKKIEIFIPIEIPNSEKISIWLKKRLTSCIAAKNIKIKLTRFDKMMKLFTERAMGLYLMSFNKETSDNDMYFQSFYGNKFDNFYNNSSVKTKKIFEELKNANTVDLNKLDVAISDSLQQDKIMIPLMHPVHVIAIRPCVTGIILNPINEGYFIFKHARSLCN